MGRWRGGRVVRTDGKKGGATERKKEGRYLVRYPQFWLFGGIWSQFRSPGGGRGLL